MCLSLYVLGLFDYNVPILVGCLVGLTTVCLSLSVVCLFDCSVPVCGLWGGLFDLSVLGLFVCIVPVLVDY